MNITGLNLHNSQQTFLANNRQRQTATPKRNNVSFVANPETMPATETKTNKSDKLIASVTLTAIAAAAAVAAAAVAITTSIMHLKKGKVNQATDFINEGTAHADDFGNSFPNFEEGLYTLYLN